jgi:hypothetical protein
LLVRLVATPTAVFLNCVPVYGSLEKAASQVVKGYGIDIAPVQLGQRAAYRASFTTVHAALEYESKYNTHAETQQEGVFCQALNDLFTKDSNTPPG